MSPEAERLVNVIGHAQVDPNYQPHSWHVKKIAESIVTELGITETMVEQLRAMVNVGGGHNPFPAVADALSTLLEVSRG